MTWRVLFSKELLHLKRLFIVFSSSLVRARPTFKIHILSACLCLCLSLSLSVCVNVLVQQSIHIILRECFDAAPQISLRAELSGAGLDCELNKVIYPSCVAAVMVCVCECNLILIVHIVFLCIKNYGCKCTLASTVQLLLFSTFIVFCWFTIRVNFLVLVSVLLLFEFRFDQRLLARKNSAFCNAHTHTENHYLCSNHSTSVSTVYTLAYCLALLRHSYRELDELPGSNSGSGNMIAKIFLLPTDIFDCNSLSNLFSFNCLPACLPALHVFYNSIGIIAVEWVGIRAQSIFQYRSTPCTQCAQISTLCCAMALFIMCVCMRLVAGGLRALLHIFVNYYESWFISAKMSWKQKFSRFVWLAGYVWSNCMAGVRYSLSRKSFNFIS